MNIRNEIKSYIIRTGWTTLNLVEELSQQYGWSSGVSNLSAKLQRESLRYKEAIQIADVLGYDIVWVKRRDD
ncbi:MAG: LLM class flavin-dependent oxidoreductase [Eubacteriales bacterium]|nr:LLM class flavin-dependent oxidoreductase [Eubacteriales bacterium]